VQEGHVVAALQPEDARAQFYKSREENEPRKYSQFNRQLSVNKC
jgi:hypothetical protein